MAIGDTIRTISEAAARYLGFQRAGRELYQAQVHVGRAYAELAMHRLTAEHLRELEAGRGRIVKVLIDLQREIAAYERLSHGEDHCDAD